MKRLLIALAAGLFAISSVQAEVGDSLMPICQRASLGLIQCR